MTGLPHLGRVLTILVFLIAGCGLEQQHGYAQSTDGSLSFRYPRGWSEVDVSPAGLEWLIALDGAAEPSVDNAGDFVQDDPFVLAQVIPLDPEVRDQFSVGRLRSLALQDRRDPTAGDDPSIRLVFHDKIVDDSGFEGHHIRFEVDLESGVAVAEHMAVFDPERTRIQRIRVACSTACFEANAGAIDELFDSVRLRP